jgi:isoquinoline 1-oxidoreductase beta subunit
MNEANRATIENNRVTIENLSRRGFLKGMAGTSAFVLGVTLLPKSALASSVGGDVLASGSADVLSTDPVAPMTKAPLQPGVYLAVDTDGTVYVIAHRSEMGNGVRTSLPRIVADELDADWARVKVVQATGDEKYGDQDTDGSHSVVSFFVPLREAGATARLMLMQAAAKRWNVPVAECSTDSHCVVHKLSGKKAGYGELAEAASKLEVPKKEELKLKPKSEWKYIGRGAPLYDLLDLCTGKGVYGQDVRMKGMLYASVLHPPVMGSSPKTIDNKATLAVAGVKQTETIGTYKPPVLYQALGGVAVLADNTWSAMQGRKKLKVDWATSPHSTFTSGVFRKELEEKARKPGKVVRDVGDVDAAFAKGGKVVEAEYYAPLLAHASMEPPAALGVVHDDGKVEVWAPTQSPVGARDAIASAVGVKKEDVTVHVTLLGGGFGRKSFPDFAVEAAVLAKKTGKLVWSREDDIKFDAYHSVSAMYMKATLGPDGKPTAWLQRTVFPPIGSTFTNGTEYSAPDELGLGFSDLPYAIPNHRSENGPAQAHVRIGWFRSVANIYHAYAIQSFVDELAFASEKDPVEYTLALLGPDRIVPKSELPKDYTNYDGDYSLYPIDTARFRRVVQMAAEKSGWGKRKLGNGVGMGIAMHRSFLTYAASVVTLHIDDAGKVHIDRVDQALDAGTVVNPEMVRNQFEGAATMGTSIAFYGEITATNGAVDQGNFDDYQMARMNNAPRETHVHIVENDQPPGGVGEPGLPAVAPALCNAVFSATGKRIRELPLSKAGLV